MREAVSSGIGQRVWLAPWSICEAEEARSHRTPVSLEYSQVKKEQKIFKLQISDFLGSQSKFHEA